MSLSGQAEEQSEAHRPHIDDGVFEQYLSFSKEPGVKLLVAEDDPMTRLIIVTKLRRLGHEVLEAANGREGWHTYLRENPRIVITDWMMPIMDGIEFCRRIREEKRTLYTYVIILTALGGKSNFLEGMRAGADDFLTKPVDLDSLQARIRAGERIVQLQSTANELEGLLPICSFCKRIRDDQESWHPVEEYVGARTDTSFQTTLCPECGKQALSAAETGESTH